VQLFSKPLEPTDPLKLGADVIEQIEHYDLALNGDRPYGRVETAGYLCARAERPNEAVYAIGATDEATETTCRLRPLHEIATGPLIAIAAWHVEPAFSDLTPSDEDLQSFHRMLRDSRLGEWRELIAKRDETLGWRFAAYTVRRWPGDRHRSSVWPAEVVFG
jgi:hypothetical protein